MAVAGMAKCVTRQAQEIYNRPAKTVHHRCGYSLVTKITACWGPVVDHHDYAPVTTQVHVSYWDEAMQPVFVCPGCGKELQVWWDYRDA
jgi:hypothetical protein